MQILKLLDEGYEIMATASNVDDALDVAEHYLNDEFYGRTVTGSFTACVITRYKRSPGQEDSFAVLLLST